MNSKAESEGWALLTDLYELTMAYGYWRQGLSEREAVFHLTFRENPFGGTFAIACGLAHLGDMLADFRFSAVGYCFPCHLRGSGLATLV